MADIDEGPKCGQCKTHVSDAQKAVLCDGKCNSWFHIACARVSEDEYRCLSRDKSKLWHCSGCDHKGNDVHGLRGAECAAELDNVLLKLKTLEPSGEMEFADREKRKRGRPSAGPRLGVAMTTWLYRLSKHTLQGMLNDAGVEFTKSDCIGHLRLLVRFIVKRESDILLHESAGIPKKVWLQKMSKQSLQNILLDVGVNFNESDSIDQLKELVRVLVIRREGSCLRSKLAGCPSFHIKNQGSGDSYHMLPEHQMLAKENQNEDLNLFDEIEIKREKIRIISKIGREKLKADPVSWKAFKEKERIRKKLFRSSNQCVYGVVWRCPMCCGMSFNNHVSLIRHLEKLPDTVRCPGCLKQVGSVENLLNHLRTECILTHLSVKAPLPNTAASVIAPGDKETNLKAVHLKEARLSLKTHDNISPNSSVVSHDIPRGETASSCMSTSSKSMQGNGKGREEDKQHAIPVKQKKARSFFNCSVCHTTFTSVEEHVKRYHSEQEVLVNRLDATEIYRPQHAQKRRRVADGSVSEVTGAGFEHSSSTQQRSVSSTGGKIEVENKGVTVKNCDRISVAHSSDMLTRKFQNTVLNNLSSDSGRKRKKILKVVLTRIGDEELKKWLRSSSEEHAQKNEVCDLNSMNSSSNTRIHAAVSEKLEHSISSNIPGGETVEKTVETDAGKVVEIGRQVIFVVKKSDRLFNTKYKQQGYVGVTDPRSDVARESITMDNTIVFNEKENKGGISGASLVTDSSLQESDLSCSITHNYNIGEKNDANRLIFRSVSCNRDSIGESMPVTVKKSINSSHFPDIKSKNFDSVANRNVVCTIGTLLQSVQPNDLQSAPPFSALMVSSGGTGGKETNSQPILKPSGEMVSKGTPGIMYNNSGITVSGVWVGPSQIMDPDNLSKFMVNRYKIVNEEMSEFTKNKPDLVNKKIICDCVNNKITDLVVNKVIDESGKILNNLYLCLKCGMGFLMYLLFCKHICEKSNFICSCSKSNHKVFKNAENNVVSDPKVCSWRKMVAVSASKNLVCSVCCNMFISDNLSFPDQHTVDLIQSNMPQNANRATANYTCKICSIVTEKRRGRVLVSKINDKCKEAVEIVVVDPNADCD